MSVSSGQMEVNTWAAGKIAFYRGTTQSVIIDANGNLGIGTSSPSQLLHVAGNIKLNSVFGEGTTTGVTAFTHVTDSTQPSIYLWGKDHVSYPGQVHIIGRSDNASADAGRIAFYDYNGSGWDLNMVINKSGNVGIGTAGPSGVLDIQSSNTGDQLVRTWNTDTSGTGKSILRIANSGNNAQGTQLQFTDLNYFVGTIATDRTNGMAFYVGQQATALVSERMRIDINGNVGIGTSSPSQKLEVNGTILATGFTNNNITISGGDLLFAAESGGDGFQFDYYATKMYIGNNAGSTWHMVIQDNGNIGIGTTAPAYKLEVNGSFAASTKSFKIDHPTKTGKKLVYGSLESPYHGIRLTGKDKLVNGRCIVQLPDYICKLARHESVNVQLTGIKCGKTLYIDDINVAENYFVVAYDKSLLESNKTYEFFWDFTAIRSDVPELITEV
jgi:hypothetical protein